MQRATSLMFLPYETEKCSTTLDDPKYKNWTLSLIWSHERFFIFLRLVFLETGGCFVVVERCDWIYRKTYLWEMDSWWGQNCLKMDLRSHGYHNNPSYLIVAPKPGYLLDKRHFSCVTNKTTIRWLFPAHSCFKCRVAFCSCNYGWFNISCFKLLRYRSRRSLII